jgi:hypothetical protein
MVHDFIDALLQAVNRVIAPDVAALKEVLIISGMPEKTQNLRYIGFNCQIVEDSTRRFEFSAVAVINNRRAARWRLTGYPKKISQIVFSTRWTRNPLDLFLNNLRCESDVIEVLASSESDYTLFGILQVDTTEDAGFVKRKLRHVRPVVAVPHIEGARLERIIDFERANEIQRIKLVGLPLYRKVGRPLARG